MTTGQTEKHIANVFSFGIGSLSVSNYLPFVGGAPAASEISFIVPQDGKLKNLYWDCDSNSLTAASFLQIFVGNVHTTATVGLPTPPFPIAVPPVSINIQGSKTTDTPPTVPPTPCPHPLDLSVQAGQRVAVYLRRTGGTITRLRVSFALEVQTVSPTWQLATDNTTVFYDGGNVGIGTLTPKERLTLSSDSNIAIELQTPSGIEKLALAGGGLSIPDDYFFKLAASDSIGWTKASAEFSINLADPKKSCKIDWTPVFGAVKYKVYYSTTSGGPYYSKVVYANTFTFADTVGFTVVPDPPQTETTAYLSVISAAQPSWLLGGKLGIGTTTPDEMLQIYSDATKDKASIHLNNFIDSADGVMGKIIFSYHTHPGGDGYVKEVASIKGLHGPGGQVNGYLTFNTKSNGTLRESMKITHNGEVYVNGVLLSSSMRWKKNIHTIKNALSLVKRLRGISYDQREDDKKTIGLIAEEVGEVIPEIVAYEENGKDAKGVDYSRLVAVLIEAVKEQQGQIEELKDTVKSMLGNKTSVPDLA
jgi:Chaperone of endosialidase